LTHDAGSEVRTPLPTGREDLREEVDIALGGKTLRAVSMARDALMPGDAIEGPAILAEPSSTTFVPAGWRALCLPTGDLLLKDLRQ
jgi:N-methylhydantoinase A/oxoprolinase/acetone carboxylase beta subunit